MPQSVLEPIARRDRLLGLRADESVVHGEVTQGFTTVEKEFRENVAERRKLGAACVFYRGSHKAIDL